MIGKYFTNWVHFTLLIWYILYIFNIKIYKYINLYYPSILILIGYILLYLYYLNLGYQFDLYVYDPVENVPKKTHVKDANTIVHLAGQSSGPKSFNAKRTFFKFCII